MFDINWIGLVGPFLYIAILIGSLITFSSIYRKRQEAKSANLEPWFPPHLQRDIYLSLLHHEPEGEKDPKVPDTFIRAALMRRAVEDIHRIIQIRTAKQALTTLLQRGSVGDDLWQRFLRAEKEMEDELRDVVVEANALGPNWGQIIFQSANEIAANQMFKKKIAEIEEKKEAAKSKYERRKNEQKKTSVTEPSNTPNATSVEEANISQVETVN